MYWWVHKFRRLPSEYFALSLADKACIIAAIQVKIETDKKAERESKRAGRGKGRRR